LVGFNSESIRAAAEVIEDAEKPNDGLLTLSNGVRLKLRTVPPLLLNTVANKFPRPEVPTVYIKDDDRTEENPNDPDYLLALKDYERKQQEGMVNLLLGRGTQLVFVPDGLQRPEEDGWLEEVGEYVDVPSGTTTQRYLSWLRFYALGANEDLVMVTTAVMRMTGLTEGEVAEAAEAFQGASERPANNGTSAPEPDSYRDRVPAASAGPGY